VTPQAVEIALTEVGGVMDLGVIWQTARLEERQSLVRKTGPRDASTIIVTVFTLGDQLVQTKVKEDAKLTITDGDVLSDHRLAIVETAVFEGWKNSIPIVIQFDPNRTFLPILTIVVFVITPPAFRCRSLSGTSMVNRLELKRTVLSVNEL
jgi:hypothetical protein